MTDLLRRIDLYFACDSRLFMSVTILQDTLGLILLVAVSACPSERVINDGTPKGLTMQVRA